jgi:hypothetical protein
MRHEAGADQTVVQEAIGGGAATGTRARSLPLGDRMSPRSDRASSRGGRASLAGSLGLIASGVLVVTGCMLGPVPQGALLGIRPGPEDPETAVTDPEDGPGDLSDAVPSSGTRPAPRTIPLDLVVLGFAAADQGDLSDIEHDIWAVADEQAIPPQTRSRLARNGLRAGLLPAPLPPELETNLASLILTPDGSPEAGSGLPAVRRTLRLLPGRETRLVARTDLAEIVVFENAADGLSGRTLRSASTAIDLWAWPAADGRVRLRAVPAIRHGRQRREWVGEDGAFRLEAGQAACRFDELAIDVEVPEGMLLLLGCGSPVTAASVGDAIFNDSPSPRDDLSTTDGDSGRRASGSRKAFLIRPLGRPIDPLFDRSWSQ